MKRTMRICAAALAIVVTASMGASAQESAKTPYEINVVLSLTGTGAFIANGQSLALRAVEKYVNDTGGIRGQQVHFVLSDSHSNPQVDIQLTSTILAKHPSFVIDGGPAAVCRGAATLYAKGPVMYCLSPGFYPDHGSYAFGAGIESRVGMGIVMRYLRMRGLRRLGVITLTDIAGQEADAALKSLLADAENKDMSVVAWEHFAANDIGVGAQMAKVKAANPDVVLGWATGTPTGTLLQGYKDLGLTIPFVASQANENTRQMRQYKSTMPRELIMYSVMFPAGTTMRKGPLKTAIENFTRSMSAVGAELGDASSAETWDAAMILIGALRSVGPNATPEQVRDYVSNLHGYYGPTGTFDFRIGNQRGLDASSSIMVRWDPETITWKPISEPGGTPLR
jgi:branched-chain amino acid transport system substrate-binding protein